LALAAIVALGRIGNAAAAEALQAVAPQAPASLQPALIDAQLAAAATLCRDGEHALAARICESLQADASPRVRAAALRGLLAARPADSLEMLIAGLASEEAWKRAVAADCVRDLRKPEEIERVAAAIPSLPGPGQLAALVALRDRSHPAVREAAWNVLETADGEIGPAALDALIASGTAQDVSRLAQLAATAGELQVRQSAARTLGQMTAPGTNQAILDLIDAQPDVASAVIPCALARRSPELVPGFLKAAEAPREATRLQAWQALETMAGPDDADRLVRLLSKTPDGEVREAAGRAVWMSCQQIPDPARRVEPLLAALRQADGPARCALLPTLGRLGGADALAALRSAMDSDDADVRDAGYRAIANWPDATVADQLLQIATSGSAEHHRVWALRAYIRVVALPDQRPAPQTFEMLRQAMQLATRPEDRELVIARLGAVRTPEALTLLLSFLDDSQLQQAAVPAVFSVAKGLSQSHPDQARPALERVRTLTNDESLLQQIPKVLRDIEARKSGD
jgi:HEAT repeat protein